MLCSMGRARCRTRSGSSGTRPHLVQTWSGSARCYPKSTKLMGVRSIRPAFANAGPDLGPPRQDHSGAKLGRPWPKLFRIWSHVRPSCLASTNLGRIRPKLDWCQGRRMQHTMQCPRRCPQLHIPGRCGDVQTERRDGVVAAEVRPHAVVMGERDRQTDEN